MWKWGPTKETKTGAANNAWDRENPWAYGVFMAEYAIQSIEVGTWSVLAWMLDDNSHHGFNWGMWTSKADGMKLRPWFYTWSLLTGAFPAGSKFQKVYSPPVYANLRILAAKLPDATKAPNADNNAWSILIVNNGEKHSRIRVRVPGVTAQQTAVYTYARQAARVDADGFPVPVATTTINLDDGFPMSFPPQSVTIIMP